MPEFEILCMANSRKRQGRCVAGIRTDGQGWIRPVAWNPEGTLSPHHYLLPDGSEAQPLDVIRLNCILPRPQEHHPEDWQLADVKWKLVARPMPGDLLPLLQSFLVHGPILLGSTLDRVPVTAFTLNPAKGSLAVVAPESLEWIIKSSREGKPRPRVGFTLGGEHYNLALTDPLWEPRLLHLAPGIYKPEVGGLNKSDSVLLTVSLSEPFQADEEAQRCCYKLVAAVMVLPRLLRNL